MSKDASLYGIPRPTKTSKNSITSSTDLAFSTALTSLISASSNASSSRNKKGKSSSLKSSSNLNDKNDIFHIHNRNSKKRALADLQAEETTSELRWKGHDAQMDDATWRRTKRKMEEKARLYAAMRRGDVEDEGDEENPKHMVDFDRKWAETQEGSRSSSDDEDEDDFVAESEEELVEFTDEFGRTKRGSKAEAVREEQRKHRDQRLRNEQDRYSARPSQPSNLIYGDTIQTAAFDPDEPITAQMEELAKKRDKEPTPPPDLHYDANTEIRNRGTGFFQFSQDAEVRRQQMENLENDRKQTEETRAEREAHAKREERKRGLEERRQLIKEKRGKAQADRFLEGLETELAGREDG